MKTTEELVEETVSKSVKSAVLVALRSINFQETVQNIIKEQIPKRELDDIYNNGYIPANKVNFSAYSFRDFMSTGIEDTSENLQLRVSKDNVVVENNLTSKNIKVADSIEAGKQLRAKILDIVGSSLLSGDTLMLGKLTTKGDNEFIGPTEFKGPAKFSRGIEVEFNPSQIPHGAIDWSGFQIPQDQIQPGPLKEFKSQGIIDNASETRITVNNEQTSITSDNFSARKIEGTSISVHGKSSSDSLQVENETILKGQTELHNNVLAGKNVDVHGKLTVLDGLEVRGNMVIPDTLKDHLVEYMNTRVNLESIIPEGGSIQIGKRTVLDENTLGGTVISSNLRKVGTLRELEVAGESRLANTIYFSPLGRIGVNTDEPTAPLDIWDEEVQVTVGKNKNRTGWLGTNRDHNLEIGVNKETKVTITPSQTIIKNPVLNSRTYTDGPSVPGHSGHFGDIHWNSKPSIGEPVGWICLENSRWAKFGVVEDD